MDADLQQKLPLRLTPLQAPLRVSLFGVSLWHLMSTVKNIVKHCFFSFAPLTVVTVKSRFWLFQ